METKTRLVVANMYRAKNKSAFFAMHQLLNKLPEFDIEFHILWDDSEYKDEWSDKITKLDCKLVDYTKEQLDEYCLQYGIAAERVSSFSAFKAIYFIIHGHYLIYDDDIILSDELLEFKKCLEDKVPCLISEVMNANCDKAMIRTLLDLYEGSEQYYVQNNNKILGFNAGIQGISLDMYEDFIEPEYFNFLLGLFNYGGIYDENGKEKTGPERFVIDTQQQSFIGVMNIIRSRKKPHILTPEEYFICPNWGHHPVYGEIDPTSELGGWDINLKSKIVHFIGHTVLEGVYYGKPKVFQDLVDKYLKQHNIE